MPRILQTLSAFVGAGDAKQATPVLLIHLNIAAYAFCYWVQKNDLGADAVVFGSFQSAISAMALIGGPVLGRLTDVRGAKFTIMVSQAGSTIMYATTAMATGLPMLFFSTVFGTVQQAMQSAQAAVTVLTTDENRALALGRLSLSYGIGMVGGSFAGGLISEHSYYACPAVAAVLSGVMVLVNQLYLPPLVPQTVDTASAAKEEKKEGFNVLEITRVLRIKAVRDVLIVSSLIGLGTSSFQSMFPMIAQDSFGFTSQDLGFFMTFGAMVGVFSNVFVVGVVTKSLGELKAILSCAAILSITYIGYAIVTDPTKMTILTAFATCSSSVLYVVLGSAISKSVPKSASGTAISLSHASRSLTGIVAPTLGGIVYKQSGTVAIGYFAAVVICLALLVAAFSSTFRKLDRHEKVN